MILKRHRIVANKAFYIISLSLTAMAHSSTTFVVHFAMFFLLCSSTSITCTNAGSPTTGYENREDGALTKTHFADFLRALYGRQTAKDNDMANDLYPLIPSTVTEDVLHLEQPMAEVEEPAVIKALSLPNMMQKRNARYCGSNLADVLQMVCKNPQLLIGKRSSPSFGYSGIKIHHSETFNYYLHFQFNELLLAGKNPSMSWPFISSDKAHQLLRGQNIFHRNTRGVHDECCLKGCSFKEMASYCVRPMIN